MPDYSDDDYRLGYFTAPDGKITLLKPLPKNDLLTLFDHHPDQMADLQSQQVELEIRQPPQPTQRSRQSQTPNGYIHLVAWSNCCLLRVLMTAWFRWYRGIHGYDRGFYRNNPPLISSKLPINSSKGTYGNLQEFMGTENRKSVSPDLLTSPKSPLNSFTPVSSPLTSPKSPLNSSNFTPAGLNPPSPAFPSFPLNSSKSPLNSSNFTPAGLNPPSPAFPSFPLNSPKSPLNSFIPAWLNPKLLDRLEAQLLDSLRSNIANIEEGHGRPATIEYLNFLGYTQASLKESKGDVQRLAQDGLLPRRPGSKLADLGIDLSAWHAALKQSVISRPAEDKGIYKNLKDFTGESPKFLQNPLNSSKVPLNPPKSPLNPLTPAGSPPLTSPKSPACPVVATPRREAVSFGSGERTTGVNSFNFDYPPASSLNTPKSPLNSFNFDCPPIDNFDPSQLTYEMLIELINKTDWNLRQLVFSLEAKLDSDQKSYQIDRARIRAKVNWSK